MKSAFVLFFLFTCLSPASAQSAAPIPSPDPYVGEWNCTNLGSGESVPQTLASTGTFSERGQPAGTWQIAGVQLILTYKDHPWISTYYLPPKDGVLRGHDKQGEMLTLSRAADSKPSYFGTAHPAGEAATKARSVPGNGLKVSPPPGPAPVAPIPGLGAAAGTPTARATPKPPVSAAATPAVSSPDSTPLTPVGKWHWHSGADRTFRENGAVLREGQVIGQWKWTDKAQGKVQVRWSAAGGQPPETYTLSPNGDHLTDTDPQGNTFTDDRIGSAGP